MCGNLGVPSFSVPMPFFPMAAFWFRMEFMRVSRTFHSSEDGSATVCHDMRAERHSSTPMTGSKMRTWSVHSTSNAALYGMEDFMPPCSVRGNPAVVLHFPHSSMSTSLATAIMEFSTVDYNLH